MGGDVSTEAERQHMLFEASNGLRHSCFYVLSAGRVCLLVAVFNRGLGTFASCCAIDSVSVMDIG